MKLKVKLLVIALLLISIAYAQSPAGFNYQAVVRNVSGEILANQAVGIRMSLIQATANGAVVYRETFSKTTNSFGLINLVIGTGTVTTGSFSTIDWGAGPYFLQTAIDNNGGTSYSVLGTSQLMSVPFALYAQSAANDGVDGQNGASAYQVWLNEGNTGTEADFLESLVGSGGSAQDISFSGTELSITEGSTVDLSSIDTDTNTQLSETEVDDFVANNGYLANEVDGDITNEIQDLSLSGSTLTITNNSSATSIDLAPFTSTNTDSQDLQLSGSSLSLTGDPDNTSVDLSTFDTDTQLSETEVDDFVDNNGYLTSFTEVDGDITNEIQDLNLSGSTLTITNNPSATGIDLAPFTGTNTDSQDLQLSGSSLSLTGDPDNTSVDLSTFDTNTQLSETEVDEFVANNGFLTTETQDLSLSGNDLSITGGSTVDLSSLANFTDTNTQLSETEVDEFVANNGYLTAFEEVDGDATNEIQDISLNGSDLSISDGSTIDLSAIDTDTNTQLTEAEVDAFVANNGYLTSFTEVDGDATNEIQDLTLNDNQFSITGGSTTITFDPSASNEIQDISLSGSDLSISDGSTLDLSGIDTDTNTQLSEAEVDGFVANNGYLSESSFADFSAVQGINEVNVSNWNNATNALSGAIYTPTEWDASYDFFDVTDFPAPLSISQAGITSWNSTATTVTNNSTNWDAAFTSVDGTYNNDDWNFAFSALNDATFTPAEWDEAYSWGNHADEGFLTAETQNLSDVLTVSNDASGQTISNLPDPMADQDAATKAYVDLLESTVTTLTDQLNTLIVKVGLLEADSPSEIFANGLSAREMLDEGITVEEMLNDGITPQELLAADITPLELLNAAATVPITTNDLYGLTYEGGLIFYLDETDGSGMVAAEEDQSQNALWGCYLTDLAGANGTTIGTGAQNTQDIIDGCAEAEIAARLCSALQLNGYNDWFLPSIDEYFEMYNKVPLSSATYLTSSETSLVGIYVFGGSNGSFGNSYSKEGAGYVRASRSFGSSIALLTESGETLQEMLDGGITPLQIYDNNNSTLPLLYGLTFDGETIGNQQLIESGITPSIIYNAGLATYVELNTAGATYQQLFDIGANIDELEALSANISDLISVGFSTTELYTNDATLYSYTNLYAVPVGIDDLELAGADLAALLLASVSPGDLFDNDPTVYSYTNLVAAGVTYAELYAASASINDLESAGAQIADLVNIVPHLTLYAHGAEYTPTTIFDALSGDTSTKINAMLNNSSPFELYYLVVWNVATIAELYIAGVSVNEMVIDPDIYPGAVTLNEINDNTSGTAEDFLATASPVTHQQLLELTSPFTLSEIYVAEDVLDGTPADLSYDIANLYGLTYKSGLVFYTADNYANVYLASSADLIDSEWGCAGSSVPGTQESAIGAGAQNTLDILADCGTANIAADRCGGFTDGGHTWFLPSVDELDALRLNLGLNTGTYWTSGEFGGGRGYSMDFSDGNVNSPQKDNVLKVRAATYISGN